MIEDEEGVRFDWRRGGAAAVGLVMALVLVVVVFAVKFANDSRERALAAERQANQVALVVRNVSANVSRAEAALARFVLDEDVKTSGNIYSSDWQLAGYQLDQLAALERNNPEQRRRVAEVRQLYSKLGSELALAASAALAKRGDTGISYFYAAARTGTGNQLDDRLENIIRVERQARAGSIERSQSYSDQADLLTNYLSWLGILVGVGAIFLGVIAVQALRQNAAAMRQAQSESDRAGQLELAGRGRPQGPWEAEPGRKAEAPERGAAQAHPRHGQREG